MLQVAAASAAASAANSVQFVKHYGICFPSLFLSVTLSVSVSGGFAVDWFNIKKLPQEVLHALRRALCHKQQQQLQLQLHRVGSFGNVSVALAQNRKMAEKLEENEKPLSVILKLFLQLFIL